MTDSEKQDFEHAKFSKSVYFVLMMMFGFLTLGMAIFGGSMRADDLQEIRQLKEEIRQMEIDRQTSGECADAEENEESGENENETLRSYYILGKTQPAPGIYPGRLGKLRKGENRISQNQSRQSYRQADF